MKDEAFVGCGITVLIGIVLGGCLLFGFIGCDTTYSEGFRDGTVMKFSKKGFVFQTYEGEMVLSNFQMDPEKAIWHFSVTDHVIAKEIQELPVNAKVRIHYKQVWATRYQDGSTGYRVTKVERLKLLPLPILDEK